MLSPEDPRLTAYASGDLPPEEAARLETELAEAPAARERLAELFAMQAELKAAFAAEDRAEEQLAREERMRAAQMARDGRERDAGGGGAKWAGVSRWMREVPAFAWSNVVATCFAMMVLGAIVIPTVGTVRETAHRSVAGSNLRQIGQAGLIAASDNQDVLPGAMATDVHDYARILAKHGGLNDATIWTFWTDPAGGEAANRISTVLAKDREALEPEFAKLKPSWAVALHPGMKADMPATTPIAWTRGWQADGTWAAHAPYGADGGNVVFLGGNVSFFRTTKDAFERFDGKGKSSNILDALPPGSRISEYTPTAVEARGWARMHQIEVVKRDYMPFLWAGLWGGTAIFLWAQGWRRRWSFFWFQGYLILSFLVAVLGAAAC